MGHEIPRQHLRPVLKAGCPFEMFCANKSQGLRFHKAHWTNYQYTKNTFAAGKKFNKHTQILEANIKGFYVCLSESIISKVLQYLQSEMKLKLACPFKGQTIKCNKKCTVQRQGL